MYNLNILGNSVTLAAQRYLMATNLEENLKRALALKTTRTESGTNLAQIPAKHPTAQIGAKTKNAAKTLDNQGFFPPDTNTFIRVRKI